MSEANRAALAEVRAHAERERPRDLARIARVLAAARVDADPEAVLAAAARDASLTINFHPDYVEAQVHGVVRLAADVAALVIDPAFAGTPTGDRLLAAAERHGFEAGWHAGLALALADVPREVPDTRGDAPMRWQALCAGGRAFRLAERVVVEHGAAPRLDAATIGRAAVSVVRGPNRRREWGAPPLVLQHLKDLWLLLVAHGGPFSWPARHRE